MTISNVVPFEQIRRDLQAKDGMTAAAADQAVDLYAKTLELVQLYPAETICPPAAADKALHHHFSRPARYMADCVALFDGKVLDHDPDAFGTPEFRVAWTRTRTLFNEHYGIDLPADPDARDVGPLSATACFVALAPAACFVTLAA